MSSLDEDEDRRRLYESMSNPLTASNSCKKLCIDEGKNFCANGAWNGGYCCLPTENCPKADLCSEDNEKAPKFFKYLACPNEAACESKNLYP